MLAQFPYTEAGWFALLCVSGALLAFRIFSRYPMTGLFIGYVLIRTALVFIQGCQAEACKDLSLSSSQILLSGFVMLGLIESVSVYNLFRILMLFNAVATLVCLALGLPSGLIGNPSMNGTFLVATLFFYFGDLSLVFRAMVLFAIIAQAVSGTGTSVPVGMLAVGASVLIVYRYGKDAILYLASFISAICWLGVIAVPHFFNPWDRFTRWGVILKEWHKLDVLWFGAGGGSFWVYGPMIQHWAFGEEGQELEVMRFLHSDWLQLFLEFGVVGVFLGVAALIETLWRHRKDRYMVASICALSSSAVFNWPMHCALTALFAVSVGTCQNSGREYSSRSLKRRDRKPST